MKIEIYSPENTTGGNTIYKQGENRPITNINSGMFPREFSEDEICFLLGEKEYKNFETGKYIFDIPVWKLNIASGLGVPKTREQLLFSANYSSKNW